MWMLVREYKVEYAIFAAVAIVFGFLPYVQTIYELKGGWLSASPTVYISAVYYTDRIQEVIDGHPFIGNPYFKEHREEFPPAFFVADWLAAVPIFLGIPMVPALLTNIVIWSLALFVLAHAILVTLGVSSRVATLGAVVIGVQVYAQMVQPVSMQIVYPFFLLFLYAYLLWLENPNETQRQIGFAVATALCAYIYTYSIQIVAVLYALLGLWIIVRERALFAAYFLTSVIGVVLCLPLIAFSLLQIQQEFYFETLERIGLIHTYIPVTLGFYVALLPLALLGLGVLLRGNVLPIPHTMSPKIFFLASTGLSLVIVMFSNVITGTDLELPQHIERFIVPWMMFATLFIFSTYGVRIRDMLHQFPRNILMVLCIVVILYSHALHIKNGGPYGGIREPRTLAQIERLEGLGAPLQWLRENVQEPAVVWADPDGVLNNLIPTFTQHYVLFEPKGVLQLLSNTEMEERYLLAHYFELDKEELIREYVQYAGTGNAVHAHKTHNKRVRICELLRLSAILGRDCGEYKTVVSYKGEEYFDALMQQYADLRRDPTPLIKKYSVSYIVTDTITDSTDLAAESLDFEKVFSNGRFAIYKTTR